MPAGRATLTKEQASEIPSASAFRRARFNTRRSWSTKTALSAPRESASNASAPVPQHRSATRAPARILPPSWPKPPCDRRLNSASRARALVGRTSRPAGTSMVRRRSSPPYIRIVWGRNILLPHPTGAPKVHRPLRMGPGARAKLTR